MVFKVLSYHLLRKIINEDVLSNENGGLDKIYCVLTPLVHHNLGYLTTYPIQ